MDIGASRATVNRAAKSWIRLKQLSMHMHIHFDVSTRQKIIPVFRMGNTCIPVVDSF